MMLLGNPSGRFPWNESKEKYCTRVVFFDDVNVNKASENVEVIQIDIWGIKNMTPFLMSHKAEWQEKVVEINGKLWKTHWDDEEKLLMKFGEISDDFG